MAVNKWIPDGNDHGYRRALRKYNYNIRLHRKKQQKKPVVHATFVILQYFYKSHYGPEGKILVEAYLIHDHKYNMQII